MIDPVLLRSFLLIAEGNSFSEAGRRLQLRQSTVSEQVRKLEASLGCRLFTRDTQAVALTPEGEALVPHAHDILEAQERARRRFSGEGLRGTVRLGLSDEIAAARPLPVLGRFGANHAGIALEVTVAPSAVLRAAFAAEGLDLVIAERWPGEGDGEPLWREELAFVGPGMPPASPSSPVSLPDPLPLVLPPAPSVSRALALAALDRAGRRWRIGCTSHGRDGARAAVAGGLGIGVWPDEPLPPGLGFIEGELPVPEPLEVVAHRRRGNAAAGALLAALRGALSDD